jgi:hypothetical protein
MLPTLDVNGKIIMQKPFQHRKEDGYSPLWLSWIYIMQVHIEAFQSHVIYAHFVPTARNIQCFILLSLKHNFKNKTPKTA